jgi:rhomboid family GlyGly-CTERM serine protease
VILVPEGPPGRQRPLLTFLLVALSASLAFLPTPVDALRFERERILAGEVWRVLSGHLVHVSRQHALVDLAVLAVAGVWWELRSRAALGAILLASALAASFALLAFTSFEHYTGSSALGSGLVVAAAVELARVRRGAVRALSVLALGLFAAKCALEAAGAGGALFVALPAGTAVAAAAHAAGGAAGALVVLVRRARGVRRA